MPAIALAQAEARTPLAEAVRFELTNGCPLPVFKTGAIDHSATLPEAGILGSGPQQALVFRIAARARQ